MDYQKELETHPDLDAADKKELEMLASMQTDMAVAGSAEDFIRHPFFAYFEKKMNEIINDSKSKLLAVETIEDLKAHKAAVQAMVDLKAWLNSHVIKGRVAQQAITLYEQDTEVMNEKIQEAVDQANQK